MPLVARIEAAPGNVKDDSIEAEVDNQLERLDDAEELDKD